MLNLNLNKQNAQRTSFDILDLAGYELPEEELRFVVGSCKIKLNDEGKIRKIKGCDASQIKAALEAK